MAMGASTVSLCSTSDETIPEAEKDLPKNLCPLIKSSYGFAKTDKCPFFYFSDVVVGETTCDGKKKMYELMGEFKDVFIMELPNTQGHLKSEDALLYVKELGLDPLYIEELPPAKHIFSHIEWRMQAYRIKVSSLKTTQDKELIFVSKEQSGKQYAIPSAFGAYAKYIKEDTTR